MKIARFLVKVTLLVTLSGGFILSGCQNSPNVKLKTEIDSVSYALGINAGISFAQHLKNDVEGAINEAVIEGFIKGFNGDSANFKINADDIMPFLRNYFEKLKEEEKMKVELENTNILYQNSLQEGVKVTKSGLQYKIITEGKGAIPTENDVVKVHYTGRFNDGRVFDSSVQRGEPAEFPVTRVIKGWTEALLMMPVGSKWELVIPSELAYGDKVLLFDVELLEIVKPAKK